MNATPNGVTELLSPDGLTFYFRARKVGLNGTPMIGANAIPADVCEVIGAKRVLVHTWWLEQKGHFNA